MPRRHLAKSSCIAAAIAAMLLLPCPRLYAAPVARVEISGLEAISEGAVRGVIGIEAGDEFSANAVERAAEALKKWGVFEAVEASSRMAPEGAVVDFALSEAKVVATIEIEGNYPYIEWKIRKHLTIHPGDTYTPERLAGEVERIKAFYGREGFVGTDVSVDVEEFPEWGGAAVTFVIGRGWPLRIREIAVRGNRAYPKGRFVSFINPYRQFSERRLAESLRRMNEFLKGHGYPKARVRLASKRTDLKSRRVDLSLDVSEGPRVEAIFVGAPRVSRKLLKRAVTIFREGSFDQYELDASAEAMKDILRERGYPDASVEVEKGELPDGSIEVRFIMDEGAQRKIKRLNFVGNLEAPEEDLTAHMLNREVSSGKLGTFYPEEEPADNEAILKAMRKHGYLGAEVGPWRVSPTPQGFSLDLTIPIEAGARTMVSEVSFGGNESFDAVRLLKALKIRPGEPLDEPGLADDKERLSAFYADNGHPYAEVGQAVSLDAANGGASIRYDIAEGPLVRIGEILVIGDVMTSQKAIKRAMDIREGDPYSYKRLMDSQLSIRRLGPFAAVSIETIGLEEREDRVHLRVKVEELKPFQVDVGFGYSTDEKLTGMLAFTNLNAFGWAKANSLKLIAGQRLSRAEIGWFDPRFLSSSFEMTTAGWIQHKKRPSDTFVQAGGALGWFRRLRRFGLFFRYELDRNYFVAGDSVAADADSLRNNTISRIALSASFDSRDSFSNPRRGFFTLGGVDIFNEIKGNRANFAKFSWQGENDITFLDRLTLSTALRFNRIQAIGSGVSVPTNELLFLGGDDTVRGFTEDSLGPQDANGKATGGRARWIMNEELRVRLARSFDWAFFYDMGSLTNDFGDITLAAVRNSFGFGLRYITPVGPIRADYGFKLDRKAGEPRGRFHFTFGYVF